MKKIAILTAIATLCITASAFAAGGSITMDLTDKTTTGKSVWASTTADGAATGTGLLGKTSSGVGIAMFSTATGYAIDTQHLSGTKAFGTSYDSTSIFSKDAEKGTPLLGTLTEITTVEFTGWTSM